MSLQTLRGPVKVGLVAAGYLVAFLIASAVVAAYVVSTSGPDRTLYGVMYAFGDSILFLAVFGVAGTIPTGAALYFLRPYPWFWRALRVVAAVIAITALATLAVVVASRTADPQSALRTWAAMSGLRVVFAPLFAGGLLLATLFAPRRHDRLVFGITTALEIVMFVCAALIWLHATAPPR